MESDATLTEGKYATLEGSFMTSVSGSLKFHVCLDNFANSFVRGRFLCAIALRRSRDRSRSQHVEFDRTLIPCVFTVTSKIFHFVDLDSDPLSRLLSTAPLCTYAVKALPR